MSRTYKDRPSKFRYPEKQWDYKYEPTEPVWWPNYIQRRGVLTKKKKSVDTEHHWMTTPSWFIREFMNRPQRRASKVWEDTVIGKDINNLDLEDPPVIGKKPHIYYW